MKKIILIVSLILSGSFFCEASESFSQSSSVAVSMASARVPSNYQGFYRAESGNWIKVNSDFVKINGSDYDIEVQNGNGSIVISLYAVRGTLNRERNFVGTITVYRDGSLYYNNEVYYK